jgi:hypothetical protein
MAKPAKKSSEKAGKKSSGKDCKQTHKAAHQFSKRLCLESAKGWRRLAQPLSLLHAVPGQSPHRRGCEVLVLR